MPKNPRDLPCNRPKREVKGGKKFRVKACQGGKEKVVRFGEAMEALGVSWLRRKIMVAAVIVGGPKFRKGDN